VPIFGPESRRILYRNLQDVPEVIPMSDIRDDDCETRQRCLASTDFSQERESEFWQTVTIHQGVAK
jgi:hypothetical protein